MREKPGTHEQAALLIEESERVLGRRLMVFNKKDAMTVTGCRRTLADRWFGANRTLSAVDLARRMCVGD
ncbi:MAG: hypothetical protein IJX14_06335 [Clostridia bacterium]|nr:hypothetical protein [Clostridia bacterium]